MRLVVKLILDPDKRRVYRLLKRWNSRVKAVIIILEVDSPRQIGPLARFYNADIERVKKPLI